MLDLDKVKNYTENKKRSRFLTLAYAQLLILLFMTIGRVIFHLCFNEETSGKEMFLAYLFGLIFDLRMATLVLLPTILLVMLPTTFTAQNYLARFVVFIQSIFLIGYLLIAAIDLGHYHMTKLRINSTIFQLFSGDDVPLKSLWDDYPIFIVFAVITLSAIIISIGIEFIKKENYYKVQYGLIYFPYRLERFFWLLIMLPLLHGSISKTSLSARNFPNISELEFVKQLSLNPLMNVLEDWEFEGQR